jgi:hypothetical protein
MFISPPARTCRYATIWRLLAFAPAALWVFIAALAYAGDANLREPGWLWSGVAMAGLSFFLFQLFSREQVSIHQEGIAHSGLFGAREIPWVEVKETRYQHVTAAQAAGAHFGLIGMLVAAAADRKDGSGAKSSQNLRIVGQDGGKINLTNLHQGYKEVIQTVLARVNERLLPEKRALLRQGGEVEFGKLKLSLQGVVWGSKAPVPYSELEFSGVGGSNFRLKVKGKWLDIVSVNTRTIPNVFVALDLITEMRENRTLAPAESSMLKVVP